METRAKILLVEDDQMLAEMIQEVLHATGEFRVEIEPRGDRAVQCILAEDPDLVILDIMLPGKDGFAVCKEVRATYSRPILILTSLEDEIRGRRARTRRGRLRGQTRRPPQAPGPDTSLATTRGDRLRGGRQAVEARGARH